MGNEWKINKIIHYFEEQKIDYIRVNLMRVKTNYKFTVRQKAVIDDICKKYGLVNVISEDITHIM